MKHLAHEEEEPDSMRWLMPLGAALGLSLVVVLERFNQTWHYPHRKKLYQSLMERGVTQSRSKGESFTTSDGEVHPAVQRTLEKWIDGFRNGLDFWTGGSLQQKLSRESLFYSYQNLALVSALMLSVCVAFYTADQASECELYGLNMCHIYGLVGCVANCALWMATLSSAFLAVTVNGVDTSEELNLLVGLYGAFLMRLPMMLFMWGSALLFLEFVIYFKLNIDPGLNCSACLGSCLVLAPSWLHSLHKMHWAADVVHKTTEIDKSLGKTLTAPGIWQKLEDYIKDKGGNCLALDLDEFLSMFMTSTQRAFAEQIFKAHVEIELQELVSKNSKIPLKEACAEVREDEEFETRL